MSNPEEMKLIEEMVKVYMEDGSAYMGMKRALAFVRKYPHLVAEVCPICRGFGNVDTIGYGGVGEMEKCYNCKGHGVIAKQERV